MKKIMIFGIALMILMSAISFAMADEEADVTSIDEVEIDEETQNETIIMQCPLGAEVRLLQLEKSITRNILKGEEAIYVLNESGYNTTELETILAELELLLEEVQSSDANSSNATQNFVDLKTDAIELTKEFRNAVKDLVGEASLKELRERIRSMVSEHLQNLTHKIQQKIRQVNRNQLHKIYSILGSPGNLTIDEYANGTLSKEQVKQQISKMVNKMTKEKMNGIFSELKQDRIRDEIKGQMNVDNATENYQQRKEERLSNRFQIAKDNAKGKKAQIMNEVQHRIEQKMNVNSGNDNSNSNNGDGNGKGGKQ